MLLFQVDKRKNKIIVTNGIGRFFELDNFNGHNYIATEIKPIGFSSNNSNIIVYETIPFKTFKITDVYKVENENIIYHIGFTFNDDLVFITNTQQFYRILNEL